MHWLAARDSDRRQQQQQQPAGRWELPPTLPRIVSLRREPQPSSRPGLSVVRRPST